MGEHGRMRCIEIKVPYGEEWGEMLWANPYFIKYVNENDEHFNEPMAEWASKKMVNRDGTKHYWSREQVKEACEANKLELPHGAHWCDMQYVANMMYADYYGSSAKTELQCILMAHDYLSDPDGYEGIAFNRWIADMMKCEHDCEIPFKEYAEYDEHKGYARHEKHEKHGKY